MSKKLIIPVLACLAGVTFVRSTTAQTTDIAVVVNINNPVANLSLGDLRKIFSGTKRTWPSGTSIKLLVRPSGSHERLALLRLLGMSESEYKQYWTAQVFRGDADAEPVNILSFGMTKEAVAAIPGAIGMVEADSVKPSMPIKVVKIDGHMPGDPGYPLH
jgi:ABC-type phosphate transport system substrate-binding protein